MKKIYIIIIVIIVLVIGIVLFLQSKGRAVNVEANKKVYNLPEEISEIIYYASMAPNSHNTQLWKVTVDTENSQMEIYLDKERTLKEVDSTDREAYISIGAFTENLVKAFEAYGYKTNLEICNEDSDKLVFIKYKKYENVKVDKDILNLIMKRHTDKSAYLNKEIDSDDMTKLIAENNHIYYLENGSEACEYVRQAAVSAMEKQAYNKSKAEEFSNWLRLSDEETLKNKDGLSAEQLGLTGIVKSIYYMITTHESAKDESYAKQAVNTTKKQAENCSGFLIITGGTSRKELIETGMLLEDTWLKAVGFGISMHPLSQVLEEEPYCDEINNKISINEKIQMILRVGYVKDYGENNHIRRDLKEYVTVNNN